MQLGSSGDLAKNFHEVGIGPLSKILAVKVAIAEFFGKCKEKPGIPWINLKSS